MGSKILKTSKGIIISIILFLCQYNVIKADVPDSLLSILQYLDSEKERGLVYNEISNEYLDVDLDKSLIYARKAFGAGTACRDLDIMAEATNLLANAWYYKGNNDSALVFFKQSYGYYSVIGNDDDIAASLNRVGIAYEAMGKYNRAMDCYFRAIEYYQRNGNTKGMADIYNNIGIVNHSLSEYTKAIEYYGKSLKAYRKINDQPGMANIFNNIGTIYHEQENADSALFYSRQALRLYEELERYSELTACYNNVGIVFAEVHQYDSAMFYYNRSLEISKKRGDNKRMATSLKQIADINIARKDYTKAKELLKQSLSIFETLNDPVFESNTLKDLSDLALKMQDYQASLEYYHAYIRVKDSLFTEEMYAKVSELQIKYETSEKNKQILLLENEADDIRHQQELLLSQRKLLIWILVGVSLIVIISLFAFRTRIKLLQKNRDYLRQKEELQKLELEKNEAENNLLRQEIKRKEEMVRLREEQYQVEMELKTKNLLSASLNIQNKNRMLRSIQNTVKNIVNIADPKVKGALKDLNRDIKINMHLASDWEEIKIHFEEVNSGFLDKLQYEFKNLTKNDLKLCTYLKLGISTKEIAQMLNISVEGVNKSRQRLKKKLNLLKEQNLRDFIEHYMDKPAIAGK